MDLLQTRGSGHKNFAHVKKLLLKGHKVVLVDTVGTDAVVIAISWFNELSQLGLEKLWIEFGVGINRKWIPIHNLTSVLGIKGAGLLFWYDFTGCDAVSTFGGKGKLSAWTTWRVFDDIAPVFEKYSHHSQRARVKYVDIRILERSTCSLYRRTTTFESANECRRRLFSKQGRQVDTIPPTKDALLQHIKRAVYQARLAQSFMSLIKFIWNNIWDWFLEFNVFFSKIAVMYLCSKKRLII